MKLVAILRIKDEISYVRRCLDKLSELVDEIIVLDNGSTDGTYEVYSTYHKIVEVLQTEGFDEGRDKIMLLDAAKKRNPDWILWTDADEVFEAPMNRQVMESYMQSKYNQILFRMCNFWLSENMFRIDGKYFEYTLHPQRSMWRNVESAYFANKKIHNGDIQGVDQPRYVSPYRLLHYGYADKEKVQIKYDRYQTVDTTNDRTYEHINPQAPVTLVKYRLSAYPLVQIVQIHIYKLCVTFVWLVYRIYNRLK